VPELPDVEGFRRVLSRHAVSERIVNIDVRDAGVIRGQSSGDFVGHLEGRVWEEPERRGKWLLAPTDGPALLLHFGMTGSLLWSGHAGADQAGSDRSDRVVFEMGSGRLVYRDLRKLRGLWLAAGEDAIAEVIGPQGPDALDLTGSALTDRLDGRRGNLKTVLMDQRVIAGLGNMLSDEVLWRSRNHPMRAFADLARPERGNLDRSLQQTLRTSVKAGRIPRSRSWLSSQRSVVDPRCPRCDHPLSTSRLGGRTSYWCPTCQPAPDALSG
jgi:formamidopyrimidine-DNA glycosylase